MPTIEKQDIINTSNLSTQYGIIAGVLMASFLLIMQLSGNDYQPMVKLSKYILLALPIVIALNIYKSKIKGDVFIQGISLGAKLSLIAGLILVVANFVIFFAFPELSFSKYSVEPTTLGQVAIISAITFFETLVYGSVISFIVLQFLKDKYKNKKV